MKRTLVTAVLAVTFVWCSIPAHPQERVGDGPWRLFRQEHPPLSYDEIPEPFVVRVISGTVSYGDGKPLKAASFEIGMGDGSVLSTDTSTDGDFELQSFRFIGPFVRSAAIRPGTYRFKVTKDGFHSAVGTIVVSLKAPKTSAIALTLRPGEGYREEQPKEPPDEQLLPLSDALSSSGATKHKEFPQKYSAVYVPVSLAAGRVRTAEFPVDKEWYDVIIQVEKPLPFQQMQCMMGVTSGPLEKKDCSSDDPLLRADWTVWEGAHIVQWGSSPDGCACIFTNRNIFQALGSFPAEAGKKYVVQIHFTKDGTPLNVANPHLVVIKHKEMW